MLNDGLKLTGKLTIALNDEIVQEVPNLVVTAGKNYVADRMKNNSTVMSHMAIGTGNTVAAAGQTALASESARTGLTSSTVTDNEIVYVDTFAAGTGTGGIVEAGIFNASSGGTMLCRTVFSVVNKGANDAMTITWTVTVS
jgi:hypothetical protein